MIDIKTMINKEKANITAIRQTLHKIPEKGFLEEKTSGFVKEYLNNIPELEVTTGLAKTGVAGLLKTGKPGKTLLIRADMDALPINEETGLSFASTHDNMMHACGHDGNVSMALVAATILSRLKDRFSGSIKFMFQPAEEGPGGAEPMIEAGILENPHVDYSVACHLWPDLPAGSLGVKPGVLMSAASFFELEILGRGGHGAMPHNCVDALDTAGQVINAIQRVVSRKINPLTPSVVTIGSLHAGSAPNIIPEKAVMSGTTRTFSKEINQAYPEILEQVIKGVCDSMGAEYKFEFFHRYPPLENDSEMVEKMKKSMAGVVSQDMIKAPESTMGAEDMAFILERTKGCLFLLGTGFDGCAPLHSPKFNFDESLLLLGVETYVRFALDLLG